MSYYRGPDDTAGTDAAPDAAAPGWPAAPVSVGGTDAPPPAPISIQQVADAAAASEARRKRKQQIIVACVVVDAIILAIVLAVFVL